MVTASGSGLFANRGARADPAGYREHHSIRSQITGELIMHFDNFTLLGIMAALAIGGMTVRLMVPERNDGNRTQ